jgi:lambda family phage minor tail protein L
MPTSSQIFDLVVSGSASINSELNSLTPSTPLYLYEIDFSKIAPTTLNYNYNGEQPMNNGIYRIYNDYNLYKIINNEYGTLKWQNNYYYPFPIQAEGFEYNSAGTLPTPKLTIGNFSPDGSNNSFYKYIRMQVQSLGDIVGAKFTRIKTFLKYIDGANFSGNINIFNPQTGIYEAELPRDIYYIDRKSLENKNVIEYELASILDVENVTLPGRTILAKKCTFQYRGEGCCYEYNSRLTALHSGVYAYVENSPISVKGLQTAPPVATENNQLFIGSIFSTGDQAGRTAIFRMTGTLGNSGEWKNSANYTSGDFVFLTNNNLKFYYVCILPHTSDLFNAPPSTTYWTSDSCTKDIGSCRLRWLKNPAFRPVIWPTNRGGETWSAFNQKLRASDGLPGYINLYTQYEVDTQFITGVNGVPVYYPRRPGAENPISEQSHGIPKDANGNYLNGYLPFGGFPGASQVSSV